MDENNNSLRDLAGDTENNTQPNGAARKQNAMALTSFILALVGLIVAGLPCGIVAIITGIMGLVKFDSTKEKGKGFAIAGLVVGVIDVIAVVLNIIIQASALL